ncbi:hypothetical protein [Persicobacter psychrovividus]|uniref:Uncharacterized protein n=1 Tax=Persicobacter psychrovividus TaxID=387638 RepID=A0ABM7VLQ7_9BACT|nr:hypothetical protein PEPS_41790 [Persicobacter psychrovividus]
MNVFNLKLWQYLAILTAALTFAACSETTDPIDDKPDPEPECEVASPEELMLSFNGKEVPMNPGNDLSEFDKRVVLGDEDATFFFKDMQGNTWAAADGKEEELKGELMLKSEDCGENTSIKVTDAGEAKVAVVNAHIDKATYDIAIEDQNFCFDFDWDYTNVAGDVKKIWLIGVVNTKKGEKPEEPWSKGVALTQNEDNPALWEADIWTYNPWNGDDTDKNTPRDDNYQFMLVYNGDGRWGDQDGTVSLDWGVEKGAEQDRSQTAGDLRVKAFVKNEAGDETVNDCTTAEEFEEDGVMKVGSDALARDFPGSADKGVHFTFNVETLKYTFKVNE